MSEKRHKINKIANYQNIIVRNSPAQGGGSYFPYILQSLRDFDFSILHTYPWYLQKVTLKYLPQSQQVQWKSSLWKNFSGMAEW